MSHHRDQDLSLHSRESPPHSSEDDDDRFNNDHDDDDAFPLELPAGEKRNFPVYPYSWLPDVKPCFLVEVEDAGDPESVQGINNKSSTTVTKNLKKDGTNQSNDSPISITSFVRIRCRESEVWNKEALILEVQRLCDMALSLKEQDEVAETMRIEYQEGRLGGSGPPVLNKNTSSISGRNFSCANFNSTSRNSTSKSSGSCSNYEEIKNSMSARLYHNFTSQNNNIIDSNTGEIQLLEFSPFFRSKLYLLQPLLLAAATQDFGLIIPVLLTIGPVTEAAKVRDRELREQEAEELEVTRQSSSSGGNMTDGLGLSIGGDYDRDNHSYNPGNRRGSAGGVQNRRSSFNNQNLNSSNPKDNINSKDEHGNRIYHSMQEPPPLHTGGAAAIEILQLIQALRPGDRGAICSTVYRGWEMGLSWKKNQKLFLWHEKLIAVDGLGILARTVFRQTQDYDK